MLVEHNLSFLLMDKLPEVTVCAFHDSKIAKKVKCAKTKFTAIIEHPFATHTAMIADAVVFPEFSLATQHGPQLF